MDLLTDDEIRAIQARHPTDNNPMDFARAIIAATIDKLAAGVSVEPVHHIMSDGVAIGYYSLDQLQTAIAAAHLAGRKSVHDSCVDLWKDDFLAAALEEAAKVVEADAVKNPITAYQLQYNLSLQHTAKDIRALKGTP
jgi:hypothetical protein